MCRRCSQEMKVPAQRGVSLSSMHVTRARPLPQGRGAHVATFCPLQTSQAWQRFSLCLSELASFPSHIGDVCWPFLESSKTQGMVYGLSFCKLNWLTKEGPCSIIQSNEQSSYFSDLLCLLYVSSSLKTLRDEGCLGLGTIKDLLDQVVIMPL